MKVAVIGLGRMGLRHLQIVSELNCEIAAIVDPRRPARAEAQAAFGLPPEICFADAEGMFDQVRPDCVIVATTAPSHAQLTCLAAARGASHVLCEKPMAVSIAQCDSMLAACLAAGTKLAVNHQMRFMEQYTTPKSIIGSDTFGELGGITVSAGNFGLAMNGTHYFEMFRFITGERVSLVNARFSAGSVVNPRGAEFEDRAGTVRLETPSGKRCYLDASADQGHGMQVVYAGRRGQLTVDELAGKMRLVARNPEHRDLPTTRYGMAWEERQIAIKPTDAFEPTRAVFKSLLTGDDFPDGLAGRQAVEILVACYVSDEQDGRTIHLDHETLPRDRAFPWA